MKISRKMTQIILEKLKPYLIDRLKDLAAKNNRSVKFSPVKSKIIMGASKTEIIEPKFQKFLASQAD